MNVVVEVIAEYLLSNRRLVVPSFGAFVTKETGERVFTDLLRTDDGVLTSLLRNKGLSEMEVAVMTDRFIFEVRHGLEQYGYYRLGEIGTLRVEPETKALRLYPPVQGEMPKQTPYVPKPVTEEKREVPSEEIIVEEKVSEKMSASTAPNISNTSKKPRKKFDFVMAVAAIILVAALVAIGYGWYVSNLAGFDDAEIDARRVVPEHINE